MKVYLVMGSYCGDDWDVYRVFDSEEKAKKFAEEAEEQHYSFVVEEYIVE